MKTHSFPLEGGSYRVIGGELVREGGDTTMAAPESASTETETGDAAAAAVDPIVPRRRKSTED